MQIIKVQDLDYLETIVKFQMDMALETEGLKLSQQTLTSGVSEVISNPSRGHYYIAKNSDDEVAGMLLTVPEWSDWRNAEVVWIHSVFIPKEFRGQKVYKEMYQHLKSMVQNSNDYCGIRLYVDKTNKNAIEVYKKLGMSDEHYQLFEWLKN